MIFGVPQGMILAILFFILIIYNVEENIKNNRVSPIYANDIKVHSKIRKRGERDHSRPRPKEREKKNDKMLQNQLHTMKCLI